MTVLKCRCFTSYDLLLQFFNDPLALNANLATLPTGINAIQYVEGLWYLFYLGTAGAAP